MCARTCLISFLIISSLIVAIMIGEDKLLENNNIHPNKRREELFTIIYQTIFNPEVISQNFCEQSKHQISLTSYHCRKFITGDIKLKE